MCGNGNAALNICGAPVACFGAIIACCNAEYAVVLITELDSLFISRMLCFGARTAEAHVCAGAALKYGIFHCVCDLGLVAIAVSIESLESHDLNIGQSTVYDGAGNMSAVTMVVFGVGIVVLEVVAGNKPVGDHGMVAVGTGIDNSNDDLGKIVNGLNSREDPIIEVLSIDIVLAISPGNIVVIAGSCADADDRIGFSVLNI